MTDPIRQMEEGERKLNQALRAPQNKQRAMQQKARRLARTPGRQARRVSDRARQMRRAPGQRAKMMKQRALAPAKRLKRQLGIKDRPGNQGAARAADGQPYRRRADRMAKTDLTVSAFLYPMGLIVSPFAGMVADWDTAFIHYHLTHARMLAFIAFWFIPISIALLLIYPLAALVPLVMMFLLWGYSWFLGFQAYGGNLVFIPFLTTFAERQGRIDFETIERIMGIAPEEEDFLFQDAPPHQQQPPEYYPPQY